MVAPSPGDDHDWWSDVSPSSESCHSTNVCSHFFSIWRLRLSSDTQHTFSWPSPVMTWVDAILCNRVKILFQREQAKYVPSHSLAFIPAPRRRESCSESCLEREVWLQHISRNFQVMQMDPLRPTILRECTGKKIIWKVDKLCTRLNTWNAMQWDFLH